MILSKVHLSWFFSCLVLYALLASIAMYLDEKQAHPLPNLSIFQQNVDFLEGVPFSLRKEYVLN